MSRLDQFLSLNRWIKAAAFLGFWAILGLAFAAQLYLSSHYFGSPISWQSAVSWSMGDWLLWGLFSVPIWWLASSIPLRRSVWVQSTVIHIAASLVTGVAYVLVRAWIGQLQRWWEGHPVEFQAAFLPLVVKTFPVNLMIYWMLVTACHGAQYYRSLQARTLRAADLEKRLSEARLLALQMQLNPHFLFNTLHAVSTLMHQDVRAAERMIMFLSELLRHALDNTATSLVRLDAELDFLDRYLEIERVRFGDRLTVRRSISEGALCALVPNLILQPLVENAIAYAVEPFSRPAVIELAAAAESDTLKLSVKDDGPGASPSHPLVEGIGLANVRARLKQLFGPAQSFEYGNRPGGGFEVQIRIPYRRAALDRRESAISA